MRVISSKGNVLELPDFRYWLEVNQQRQGELWKDTEAVEKEVLSYYRKIYKELEKTFFAFAVKNGVNNQLTYSQARMLALMKELYPYIDDIYSTEEKLLTEHLFKVYEQNYYKGLYDLSKGLQISTSFVKLNERAVKTAVQFAWSGADYVDRISVNKDRLKVVLKQEITASIIRGDALDVTAKAVKRRLNISGEQAQVLVQTETAAVMTASDKKMYKDFDVDEYQYDATLDNKTTPTCRELDGQTFPVEEMTSGLNAPPMHPRCRSTTVPYTGLNFGKRLAKRLDNGQAEYIPADTSYQQWEKKFIK